MQNRIRTAGSLILTGLVAILCFSSCETGNAGENVTYRALYTPCGKTIAENPSSNSNVHYTFTSHEVDAALASQDFGARTYLASFCQFASGDPVDPSGTSSYAYPHNNPLRFVDPSGAQGREAQGQYIQVNGQWIWFPPFVAATDALTVEIRSSKATIFQPYDPPKEYLIAGEWTDEARLRRDLPSWNQTMEMLEVPLPGSGLIKVGKTAADELLPLLAAAVWKRTGKLTSAKITAHYMSKAYSYQGGDIKRMVAVLMDYAQTKGYTVEVKEGVSIVKSGQKMITYFSNYNNLLPSEIHSLRPKVEASQLFESMKEIAKAASEEGVDALKLQRIR